MVRDITMCILDITDLWRLISIMRYPVFYSVYMYKQHSAKLGMLIFDHFCATVKLIFFVIKCFYKRFSKSFHQDN